MVETLDENYGSSEDDLCDECNEELDICECGLCDECDLHMDDCICDIDEFDYLDNNLETHISEEECDKPTKELSIKERVYSSIMKNKKESI